MKFIDYNSDTSGKHISPNSDITRLLTILRGNISSFIKYKDSVNPLIDNSNYLVNLVNSLSKYFGSTPNETYLTVDSRLERICRQHGIVRANNNQPTHDILLGEDMLVSHSYDNDKAWVGGELPDLDKSTCFRVYHHDEYSLNPAYYDTEYTYGYSVIGVDLPMLAANIHQIYLNSKRNVSDYTSHGVINKVFYSNVAKDVVNIALLNRFVNDTYEDSEYRYEDDIGVVKFRYTKVNKEYLLTRGDFKEHFSQLGKSTLFDLNNNLPLVDDDGKLPIAKVNDYYLDNIIWVNGFLESVQLNRLIKLSDDNNLKLNIRPYTNKLSRTLSTRQVTNYTRHLDGDIREYVKNNMLWD